jgi:hypothetical protein
MLVLRDGTAAVWSFATEKALSRRRLPSNGDAMISISPEGDLVAIVRSIRKGAFQVEVYDLRTGKRLGQLAPQTVPVVGLRYAPHGLLYWWDGQGTIRSWNVVHRREHSRFCALAWAASKPSHFALDSL